MRYSYAAVAFASGAFAAPLLSGYGGDSTVCPSGLYSTPQCCATDILGVAALNCYARTSSLAYLLDECSVILTMF